MLVCIILVFFRCFGDALVAVVTDADAVEKDVDWWFYLVVFQAVI